MALLWVATATAGSRAYMPGEEAGLMRRAVDEPDSVAGVNLAADSIMPDTISRADSTQPHL
ncbi:MAG: hypothetical protein K2M85_02835, partial [Paramuribaculum sp.]|nr:hypothetical protein [Paramuribaculum sp.]